MVKIDLPGERKVGHLTLLRSPRAITSREFHTLPMDERLAIVRSAEGRAKYQLLLESEDAERLIRNLPAQEIYLLIKELGLEYAANLLPMVSVEQFTAFLDLDCWELDLLSGEKAQSWISALLAEGGEKALAMVLDLDFEFLTLFFKKSIAVIHGPDAYVEDDEACYRDGGYEMEYHDSESGKFIGGLLNAILQYDRQFYPRLIESVRWETEALLEEEVLQLRIGRLQDMGFPDPFEARRIFAFSDPSMFDAEEHLRREGGLEPDTEAPGFILTAFRPEDILGEILAEGVSSEICWELTYLLNKLMTADHADVGDYSQVREKTEELYRYLNIALEHLCGTDVEKASRVFDSVYTQALFRLGFNLTLELRRRAHGVKKSPVGPYLDGPHRALVAALSHVKPLFYEGLEKETRAGERPFANLREVRRASERLGQVEMLQRLFTEHFPFTPSPPEEIDLKGCFPETSEDLALSDFFLTALANRILGRDFLPLPIPAEELAALHARVCAGEKVSENLRRETEGWLESMEPGGGEFAGYCLDLWEEEFCSARPEKLDPRFIGGLIVKRGG